MAIYSLRGIVGEVDSGDVVLLIPSSGGDTEGPMGVSYLIKSQERVASSLAMGSVQHFYVHEVISEVSHVLYGFVDKGDLHLFRMLISVSGVGPSKANALLDGMSSVDVCIMLRDKDVSGLCSANGIGKKMAESMVLHLSDKVAAFIPSEYAVADSPSVKYESLFDPSVQALVSMGWARKGAQATVGALLKSGVEWGSIDHLVKTALQWGQKSV